MKQGKQKKPGLWESLGFLLQQVFLRTVGSWGPVIVDESGNIVEEPDLAMDAGAHASRQKNEGRKGA